MVGRRVAWWAGVVLLLHACSSHAQRPVRMVLSQPVVEDTLLRVLVSVEDDHGSPVRIKKASQLRATYGAAAVKVTRVSSYDDKIWGTDVHVLMDVSKSISDSSLSQMREVARKLLANLGKGDRLAISSIGSRGNAVVPFTRDTLSINRALASLVRSDSATNLHRTLLDALDIASATDTNAIRRSVVVIMSDGLDDATASLTDSETTNRIRESGFLVLALGYEGKTTAGLTLEGISHLGVLARASGGDVIDARSLKSDTLVTLLQSRIRGAYLLEGICTNYGAQGTVQHLNVTCTVDGVVVQSGVDVRSLPGERKPVAEVKQWYYYVIPVVFVVLALLIIVLRRRSRRAAAESGGQGALEVSEKSASAGTVVTPVIVPPVITIRIEPVRGADQLLAREYTIKDRIVFGRDSKSDYPILRDPHVSARHAELQREEGAVMLMDLQSTNGTSLNGVPVQSRMRLQDGDIVGLGGTELRIFINVTRNAHTMS